MRFFPEAPWNSDEDIKVSLLNWFAVIVTAPIWVPRYIIHIIINRRKQ